MELSKICIRNSNVTPVSREFIANNKLLYALVSVILVIKLQIRSLPVKLSYSPFTHGDELGPTYIFVGNYLPLFYDNRKTWWVSFHFIYCPTSTSWQMRSGFDTSGVPKRETKSRRLTCLVSSELDYTSLSHCHYSLVSVSPQIHSELDADSLTLRLSE